MSGRSVVRPVRCRAHAQSTGEQCRRSAIPGGLVCRYHGGAAPQVRAAAARRVAAARAMSLAALIRDAERRDPADVLLSATHVADAIVTKMVDALEGAEPVTAEMVASLAEAVKLAASMAKLTIDAAGPQLEAQRIRIAREHLAPQLATVIGRLVDELGLSAEQRALVPAAVEAAVRGFLAERRAVRSPGARALPPGGSR